MRALEYQFPGLRARVLAAQAAPGLSPLSEVQPPHPAECVDNSHHEVQGLHPATRTECSERTSGVQLPRPPGAAVAPEPPEEPSNEPSAAPHADRQRASSQAGLGGGPAAEFFAALGDEWRLTGSQQARLSSAVAAAVGSGWDPQDLAAWTCTNTAGIRNPYAVLAARLSPAELPPPSPRQRARLPWCGECDERTRLVDFDGDAPRPCPTCRPMMLSGHT